MNAENTPDLTEATSLAHQDTSPSSKTPSQADKPAAQDKQVADQQTADRQVDIQVTEKSTSVYWIILFAGVALLLSMPEQAKWIETKRGWFTQPMVGSALGLSVMVTFAAWRAVFSFKAYKANPARLLESAFYSLGRYRVAIITSALFFVYVNTLSVIGFVPATLIFVTFLLWLSRLLDRFWFAVTLFTLFVVVLIFRVGLALWLPDVWLYEFLPEQWVVFANQYL